MYFLTQQSWTEGLVIRSDALLADEMRPFDKSAFAVDSPVDEIRIVEGQLGGAVDDVVRSFDAKHKRVVLIADFISPAAEAAAGIDILCLELRQELFQNAFALQARGWVAVVEASVISRNNLVVRLEHLGVDKALDAVFEHVRLINWFHR